MRFVLVHGGFHAAWCWSRTIPELERLGHEAVAVDLPGHGARIDEVGTLASRAEAILAEVQPGDVLVGHSGGGYDITIAANAAPHLVGHVTYLAAGLPVEGMTIPDAMMLRPEGVEVDTLGADTAGMIEHLQFHDDGSMTFATVEGATELFYNDCDAATAQWAFDHLCAERGGETSTTPVSVPAFWAADLPRSYIHCASDHAQPAWMSSMIAARLGVEQLVIDASHSPFLSRPRELAELLVHATTTTPIGPLSPT